MILYILRGAFILLTASVAALYLLSNQWGAAFSYPLFALILGITIVLAAIVVVIDAGTPHKKLSSISGIFLGLIAGLVVAYPLWLMIDLIGLWALPNDESYLNLLHGVKVLVGMLTCYVSISLVLQTKDDFRFVIPYVEFTKQVRGNRPALLDTSVVIDGRILDIVETGIMQGTLVLHKFVLNELQTVADSADKLRRARGRRGLDILQKLQDNHIVEVVIEDRDAEGGNVDQKLVSLAQLMQARIMTNDYNLNKIATLRGVDMININDLAQSLRPVALPGEAMTVKIVKPGENPTQGVGYLDDVTMIVVEQGRDMIGREVNLVVTSMLQTSAGRMIFGRLAGPGEPTHTDKPASFNQEAPVTTATAASSRSSASRITGRNPRRG